MRNLTRKQVNDLLKREQGELSLRSFANVLEVSAAYLSDVYLGKRNPGPKILKPFGLRAVRTTSVHYERAK